MGYTHYWYRPEEIPKDIFRRIVDDFRKVIPLLEMIEVKLAGPDGTKDPIVNYDEVMFNGDANCGHPKGEIIIPWPDDDVFPFVAPRPEVAISGRWFAGHLLRQRVCNGDCSYEAFIFPRIDKYGSIPIYNEERLVGKVFNCCKTAFRPYDLAVTAFLVIAKHYLGDEIIVKTDGMHIHWQDAINICQNVLGYGSEFVVKGDELVKEERSSVYLTRSEPSL